MPYTQTIDRQAYTRQRGLAFLLLACLLTACGSRPTAQLPTPTPTVAPPTPTLPPVTGQAENLILLFEDLPGGFQLAGEDRPGGNAYSVIYLRPEALTQSSSAGLIGVIVNLSIHADAAAAQEEFAAQGMNADSIKQDVQETSGNASGVDVLPHTASVAGADEVVVFRVRYAIGPTRLLEYRYRMRVGNAVVSLIVTAPAPETGVEPDSIREQAQALAEQQVRRINDSRR